MKQFILLIIGIFCLWGAIALSQPSGSTGSEWIEGIELGTTLSTLKDVNADNRADNLILKWNDTTEMHEYVADIDTDTQTLDNVCDLNAITDQAPTFDSGGAGTTTIGGDIQVDGGDFKIGTGTLTLQTTFGTDTDTQLKIIGKGTGGGYFTIWNETINQYMWMDYDEMGSWNATAGTDAEFKWGYDGGADIIFWPSASFVANNTPEVVIGGHRAGDSFRQLEIGVGVDVADQASFDGVSIYHFDGNITGAWAGNAIPVANGGTGLCSWTANAIIIPDTTTSLNQMALPGVNGYLLYGNTTGDYQWASNPHTKVIYWENVLATDDFKSVFYFEKAATIIRLGGESSNVVYMTIQEDDGSPADIETTDLLCDATPADQTSGFEDAAMAAGSRIDLAVNSVATGNDWCSFWFSFTYD